PFIRTLLENYQALEQGQWFESENGERTRKAAHRAPFEAAVIAKVDIDRAIEILGEKEKSFIIAMYLDRCSEIELMQMFPYDNIGRLEGAIQV
ncbi:MAG: hypothetical protein ABIH42_06530, partial [Planctomycetota bacterium]